MNGHERTGRGINLLGTRDFGLLWAGQAISQIGDGLNKVALLWFVYTLTGSALKMTVVGLLQTLPPLLLGPVIGVYLDRLPKKSVMIWVDATRAVLVLLIPGLYTFDALTLERLYALVFLLSVVSTVFGPALSSAVPLIVERSQLTAANALLQSTTNIGLLLGPAVSGIGIALIGAQNVLYFDSATFLISTLCLMPIRMRPSACEGARSALQGRFFQDALVGFRFVFIQQQTVLKLMLTSTLFSLGASAFVFLLPIVAKELLRVGPVQMGWLWSSLGAGMLTASAALAFVQQGDLRRQLRMVATTLAVGGMATCGLTWLDGPLMAGALIAMIGGSTAVFTPVVWALLQELTPGHLLGRVFTTFSTGGMASAMIGMLGVGWTADTFGPSIGLMMIGLVLILTATVTAYFSERRRMDLDSTSGLLISSVPHHTAS